MPERVLLSGSPCVYVQENWLDRGEVDSVMRETRRILASWLDVHSKASGYATTAAARSTRAGMGRARSHSMLMGRSPDQVERRSGPRNT